MMLIFNFEFWVEFGEEMGVITTRAPQGLWLPNPTKKFTNLVEWWIFKINFYLEIMFLKFSCVGPSHHPLGCKVMLT